jgi:hypothetical protein
MPLNALTPKAQNSLVRQTDEVQDLLYRAAQFPQYGELVDYLSARRMMPPIETQFMAPYKGMFHQNPLIGGPLPKTGKITIRSGGEASTVIHELTHAADAQINNQYYELKQQENQGKELSPVQKQFVDAFEKMVRKVSGIPGWRLREYNRAKTAEKLAPDWLKQQRGYRSSDDELPAFGMGNTVHSTKKWPDAPPHVDPTYATEFSVLMDLARRAQPVIPGR